MKLIMDDGGLDEIAGQPPPEPADGEQPAEEGGQPCFLSSANLTEYAFTINMELGALVTGGTLPTQVQEHFDCLIQRGLLIKPAQ